MPGLIALIRAVEKGDEVGILTARANPKANKSILLGIQKIVKRLSGKDFKFKKAHVHFVNDSQKKYEGSSSAEKKANVIRDYMNSYDSVKFYDDEEKNLDHAKRINKSSFDIRKFDANKLEEPKSSSKKKIHLFDLDGTIINSPAKIRIKEGKKTVDTFTQEEFAERIASGYKLKENQEWDFSDFTSAKIIKEYMSSYRVFKKAEE